MRTLWRRLVRTPRREESKKRLDRMEHELAAVVETAQIEVALRQAPEVALARLKEESSQRLAEIGRAIRGRGRASALHDIQLARKLAQILRKSTPPRRSRFAKQG